jgi:hypothetical protein
MGGRETNMPLSAEDLHEIIDHFIIAMDEENDKEGARLSFHMDQVAQLLKKYGIRPEDFFRDLFTGKYAELLTEEQSVK